MIVLLRLARLNTRAAFFALSHQAATSAQRHLVVSRHRGASHGTGRQRRRLWSSCDHGSSFSIQFPLVLIGRRGLTARACFQARQRQHRSGHADHLRAQAQAAEQERLGVSRPAST
eukprot:COSAG04_NODE_1488_length_6555_cov_2.767658_3_plen_116_part_00